MLVRYILGGESLRQIHLDGRSPEAAKDRWKLLKSCPPHILEYVRALKAAEPTVPAGIDAALQRSSRRCKTASINTPMLG